VNRNTTRLAFSTTLKMKVIIFSKRQKAFNKLHGVVNQMIKLFITTAVRTQNPFIYATEYLITLSDEMYLTCNCSRSVSVKCNNFMQMYPP
jgi:hypothetical protein